MFVLQRLGPEHESAVRAFEHANRAYFVQFIGDRGDAFYEHFAERYRALLAEQAAGTGVFHVLVDEEANVVGRFNLYDVADGTADLGYRVAQRVAGRGVATAAVQELCQIAAERYGLRTLTAATTDENLASQRVLTKAGFAAAGPTQVDGRHGMRYTRSLV